MGLATLQESPEMFPPLVVCGQTVSLFFLGKTAQLAISKIIILRSTVQSQNLKQKFKFSF